MALSIKCPECNSGRIRKRGFYLNKKQTIQRYRCRRCKKGFTMQTMKNVSYPPKVILTAISLYNLGHTFAKVSQLINGRYQVNTKPQTIHTWLRRYRKHLPYTSLRDKCRGMHSPWDIIFRKKLYHQQVYEFQYHKGKMDILLLNRDLRPLKNYLLDIETERFPHKIFNKNSTRISETRLGLLPAKKILKKNIANTLTGLALGLAGSNKHRHQAVQGFMLANDAVTIAAEIPVFLTGRDVQYFTEKGFEIGLDLKMPLVGHIDLLQVRNGLIHILDYKPDAAMEKSALCQLTLYALALASRTRLALMHFKCAWFDETDYLEFFPLHCVKKKGIGPY